MARDDLFAETSPAKTEPIPAANVQRHQPLAARMRPRDLNDFVGQSHILAPGQLLRRAIEADRIQSLIFYGPPGTGKTSLAQIIAAQTKANSSASVGWNRTSRICAAFLPPQPTGSKTRANPPYFSSTKFIASTKRNRTFLLPDVESGVVRLIGATTHNPFFFVNSPLVSRSQSLNSGLSPKTTCSPCSRARLKDPDRGLGYMKIEAADDRPPPSGKTLRW